MLQNINESARGWISWVIIGLISVTFALWGIQNYLNPSPEAQAAATVGDVKITEAQLTAATERLTRMKQAQLKDKFDASPAMMAKIRKDALKDLVDQQALGQAAEEQGFRIGQAQVNQAIMQTPIFEENGQFSQSRFLGVLSSMRYSQEQFFNMMHRGLLINQVRMGVVNTAFALPEEIQQTAALVDQTRDIAYTIIPATRFDKQVTVTPEQEKAYYDKNLAQYQAPEQVSIEYISLSLNDLAKTVQVTDKEIQTYYQNNLSDFSTQGRWQVAHILVKYPKDNSEAASKKAQQEAADIAKKAKAGDDFSALAAEYSQDIITAKKGGVLPWITSGNVDPSFEKAVTGMKETGDIVGPVATKYGYDIIKLLKVEKPQVKPLAEVKQQIATTIKQQKAEQLFANDNDQLANISYEQPSSLAPAAKAVGLDIKTTTLFSRQGGDTAITKNPKVINAAFSDSVLAQKNNSAVLQLNDTDVIVLRVKQHKPASAKAFKNVQAQINKQLTQQQAADKAKQLGEGLLKDLRSGEKAPELMAKNQLDWKTIDDLPRQEMQPAPAIVKAAFALAAPTKAGNNYDGLSLASGGYAIVTVSKINNGKLSETEKARRDTFHQDLEMALGLSAYELYQKGQISRADISYPDNDTAE